MLLILLGALLVLAGVVFLAGPPLWRARLSGRRSHSTPADETLEPVRPAAGFRPSANWPGLAMVALGFILLLVGAAG